LLSTTSRRIVTLAKPMANGYPGRRGHRAPGALRHAGVLINRTGPLGNVLKIRPSLVFTTEHVEQLVAAVTGSAS
jgi:4-aminobutyrate aminotransferase-like enzyme